MPKKHTGAAAYDVPTSRAAAPARNSLTAAAAGRVERRTSEDVFIYTGMYIYENGMYVFFIRSSGEKRNRKIGVKVKVLENLIFFQM